MLKKDSERRPPFTFSQAALGEIKKILAEKNIPAEYGVRVGVKGGGGCGGASYVLGFDKTREGDDVFLIEGITVYMEKKHALFLAGKYVDFEDGAVARGFVFTDSLT